MTIYFFWITHKHCVSPCSQLRMEVSLWEHIKCFPCTLRGRNWKTQQSLVIFHSVVFEESSFREITLFTWRHRFRKSPFSRVWTLPKKADITHLITHLLSLLLEAILFFQVCSCNDASRQFFITKYISRNYQTLKWKYRLPPVRQSTI